MSLKRVFEPISIGNVDVPNRIVRTAHGTNIGWGRINDDLIAYHVARAKGGVGLSFIEYCSVHPTTFTNGLRSWDDSIIGEYRRLMSAVKPYGMRVFQQLSHGGHMYPGMDGVAWSASTMPNPLNASVPVAMTRDQIAEIVEAFRQAARRCAEGGIEGLEVHFAHGYLVHQFLSPLTNRRTDEYGGSLDNRLRFGREILRAVRTAVPAGFPVGIRLSDQYAPGGNDSTECARVAGQLEAEGLIDFINGSQGSYYVLPLMLPAMDRPLASMFPSAADVVAGVTHIPRIVTPSRVRTLEEAEQFLRDGVADLITLQRAHIADPDLVRKTREGRVEQVRPCIACNQGCVGGLLSPAMRLGCTINPAVGFERSLSEDLIEPSANPLKVLVVGGGPAGMEAARVARLAGHSVVLAEAGKSLGGLMNVAKLGPRSSALGDFVQWQEHEIYRLGVEVRFNSYLEAADIDAEGADVVIVATGSSPRMDGVQAAVPGLPARGVQLPHVISSTDLLTAPNRPLGATALVFDDVGQYESIAAAEWLIEHGVAVTFATRFALFAPIVETWTRTEPALERLQRGQFTLMTRMHLVEIEARECLLRPLQSDRIQRVPADLVVLVLPRDPLDDIWRHPRSAGRVVEIVGDARSPRDLQAAVREGHLAARALGKLTSVAEQRDGLSASATVEYVRDVDHA